MWHLKYQGSHLALNTQWMLMLNSRCSLSGLLVLSAAPNSIKVSDTEQVPCECLGAGRGVGSKLGLCRAERRPESQERTDGS